MAPEQNSPPDRSSPGLRLILENWALRFLLIGLISLALFSGGVGKWVATHVTNNSGAQDDVNHFFGEIGFAFTIAAFLILTTERSAKRELQSQFSQYMEKIREEFRTYLASISNVETIGSFLNRVHASTDKNEVRALAADIFNDYTTDLFKIEHGGFAIADRNWAMEASKKFYATLLSTTAEGAELEIRVTHSSSIKIWENEEDGRDTLSQQRRLIRQKRAKIIRIFVGTADAPAADYKSVMDMMSEYGIETHYVQRDHPERVLDMTWVPALNLRMTWNLRRGGNVADITIASDARDQSQLEATWQSLLEDAKGTVASSKPGPAPHAG
jgi:hypothetical protein